MICASSYLILDDKFTLDFLVPAAFDDEPDLLHAQGREAAKVLYQLNERISGDPELPCAQILVFNDPELVGDDAPIYLNWTG